jgi:hypothetical protein
MALIISLAALVASCRTLPEKTAAVEVPAGMVDQRVRFASIFCAVLDDHGAALPDSTSCAQALSPMAGAFLPVPPYPLAARARQPLVGMLVPGIGYDCFRSWMHPDLAARDNLRTLGYDLEALHVEALSSSTRNASLIRDAVMATPDPGGAPRLVLIGYSKGAPDVLEAVVRFPEIRSRIAAVVSVAGAVRGSPIADQATDRAAELLVHFPGAQCDAGDGQAVASLSPGVRNAFLAENPLPADLRYYSLVTLPTEDRISRVLEGAHRKLSLVSPMNDGQLIYSDQFIPGSTLLAFLNADHWAAVLPIHREHRLVASTLVNRNEYPREALLEALMRFIDEDVLQAAD